MSTEYRRGIRKGHLNLQECQRNQRSFWKDLENYGSQFSDKKGKESLLCTGNSFWKVMSWKSCWIRRHLSRDLGEAREHAGLADFWRKALRMTCANGLGLALSYYPIQMCMIAPKEVQKRHLKLRILTVGSHSMETFSLKSDKLL